MRNDFTRINFGWWSFAQSQRSDIIEYVCSLAAASDCPGSICARLEQIESHPRSEDILRTVCKWERARAEGFITDDVKERIQRIGREHTLLINENGNFELAEWEELSGAFSGEKRVSAFIIDRGNARCVVIWDNIGKCSIRIPEMKALSYKDELFGDEIVIESESDALILHVSSKRYLITDASVDEVKRAFEKATVIA